ncbi:hypothetical protein [Actinotalea sp. C106]|uniref:hypothetical protein n=1 Tax=Actinotalea sp. C106 TaxID=2908644 RepID=UPI002028A218|nr:hypothetical protein [Actinotalea sp. C106]
MVLRLIGYWRNDQHPEYPDPHDLVDEGWDKGDRFVATSYLMAGTYLRHFTGLLPCRFCGQHNGASEYTDGVLVWPAGLSHYLEEHGVWLAQAIEDYILGRAARLEAALVSADWWLAGARQEAEPLEPLERVVWHANAQLAQQPGRTFPGLFVQADTLSNHVDGPASAEPGSRHPGRVPECCRHPVIIVAMHTPRHPVMPPSANGTGPRRGWSSLQPLDFPSALVEVEVHIND